MNLNIDGKDVQVEVDGSTPLLWTLRDFLNKTGTKYGCGMAQCGACTVHLNGQAIRSCVTPTSAAVGQKITTIEGIKGKEINALRSAWSELEVPQCGYCQSGQLMSAADLLTKNSNPTIDEINEAMDGNICRCATYGRIRKGIQLAAQKLRG
jgi:isoquinoline 1-oxidoreductase alpha subunit